MLLPLDTVAALLILLSLVGSGVNPISSVAASALLLAGCAVIAVFSFGLSRAVIILNRRQALSGAAKRHIAGHCDIIARGFVVITYWQFLMLTGWHVAVNNLLGFADDNQTAQSLIGLIPYIIFCFSSWLALFPFHLRTVSGKWTVSSYLMHKVRYNLFILALGIPSIILFGAIDEPESGNNAETFYRIKALSYVFLFASAWVFPYFLKFFWGCRRLPDGETRTRLLDLQEKGRVRFSQIYEWDLGGGALLNAAAVGFLPPFRYLFMSRALLEKMTPDEIDGVACHEMGHVKYNHMPFYFAVTIAVMEAMHGICERLPLSAEGQVVATIFGIVVYFRFGFAYLSRRMERQADLYSLRILGESRPLIDALEKIGRLSGNIRSANSWHHMSIAERVAFLRAAESHPDIADAHDSHVRSVKLAGYFSAAAVLGSVLFNYAESAPGNRPPSRDKTVSEALLRLSHKERLARIFPEDPECRSALADSLLSLNLRQIAQHEAAIALNLAKDNSEREKTLKPRGKSR